MLGALAVACDPAAPPDAGPSLGMDAGAPDAGPRPMFMGPDASGDAGGFEGTDGGTDAGEPDCVVAGVPGQCLHVDDCDGDRVSTPGFCPGPAEIQCCTPRGEGCDPSAMPTPNDGLTEAPGEGGCQAGMIAIGTFCIDRYEASLVRADGSGSWSPFHNPGSTRVRAVSIAGAIPQGYITGDQAAAACAEAGKRLCTDTEWLRACRGSADNVYPYGDVRQDGVCNDARARHPAVERFMSNEPWVFSMLGDACINQLPDSLARTGDQPGCVTSDGAFDMMGNLHEWTSDPTGTFRGGYYVDTVRNGNGCLYRTTAHDTAHSDYSTGFRCCSDP